MGMMLYFYILDTPKEGPPVLIVESHEAEIKNGLVRPMKGKFFHPAVGGFTMECHIGRISGRKERPVVILKEPNLKLAKGMLAELAKYEVKHYRAMTDLWTSRLKAVEEEKESEEQ